MKEMVIWKKAGINPAGELVHRDQGFYVSHHEAGQ